MNENQNNDNDEINLIDLFAALWHRKVMIIIITLIGVIGVVIFAILSIKLPPETSPLPGSINHPKVGNPDAVTGINNDFINHGSTGGIFQCIDISSSDPIIGARESQLGRMT